MEEAILQNDIAKLNQVLQNGTPPVQHMASALNLAIKENCSDAVKTIIECNKVLLYRGENLLFVAARAGSAKPVIDVLVTAGCDLNAREPTSGKTALILAAAGGFADTAEALLNYPECERDAKGNPPRDVRRLDHFHTGLTGLMEAIMTRNKGAPVVEVLLRRGANPNIPAVTKLDGAITPLMQAAMYGLKGVVEMLLQAGAEVDTIDESEQTALHWAVKGVNLGKHTETDVIKPLIAAGADLNAISNSGGDHITPVLRACDIGDYRGPVAHDMAVILIAAGSDVNRRDMYGKTILHRAVSCGWLDIIDMVTDRGADITILDYSGHSVIYDAVASYRVNVDAFKTLLDRNWDVKDKYVYLQQCNIRIPNSTLLDVAMHQGNLVLLPYLVAAGCPMPSHLDDFRDRVTMESHVFSWMKMVSRQPLTLKEWSRIAVRRALPAGCHLQSVLSECPIPKELVDYVLLRTGVGVPEVS